MPTETLLTSPILDEGSDVNTLYVTWSKMDKCRMPQNSTELLIVEVNGQELQLCMALTHLLEGVVKEWSQIKGRTNLELGQRSVAIKNKSIEEAKKIFQSASKKNQTEPRAIVEAVSLISNFIRTIDILQEAYINFRGQGLLGGGIVIEAKIDISVAGLYRYSQFMHHLGKDHREVPYPCAGKSITNKTLANVLRSNADYVQSLNDLALEIFRKEMKRDSAA